MKPMKNRTARDILTDFITQHTDFDPGEYYEDEDPDISECEFDFWTGRAMFAGTCPTHVWRNLQGPKSSGRYKYASQRLREETFVLKLEERAFHPIFMMEKVKQDLESIKDSLIELLVAFSYELEGKR